MKSNNIAVIIANLIPTVKYPIAANTPNVYHHGTWVKNISSGLKSLRYTNPLSALVNAIKLGLTVKDSTLLEIGCLIDNLHSSGNDPILKI